jgi:toxin secretion/phage lysis holin
MMISIYLQEIANIPWLSILVPLTFIDYVSGVVTSMITKETSSKIGYKGILKKIVMYMGLLAIGVVQQALPDIPWLFATFKLFMIVNESISVLENVARAGVPLPEKLVALLIATRDEANNPKK